MRVEKGPCGQNREGGEQGDVGIFLAGCACQAKGSQRVVRPGPGPGTVTTAPGEMASLRL